MQTQRSWPQKTLLVFVSCVLTNGTHALLYSVSPSQSHGSPPFFVCVCLPLFQEGRLKTQRSCLSVPTVSPHRTVLFFFLSRHLRRYSVVYPLLDYLNYTQKVLHWLDCNEIDWEIIDFQFLLSDLMNIRSVIVLTSSQATIWTIWRSDRAW